jgi:hypothetical protein
MCFNKLPNNDAYGEKANWRCEDATHGWDVDSEPASPVLCAVITVPCLQDEMKAWWKHHTRYFTRFSTFDRQQVEDLTGCIPLLLRPFVKRSSMTLDALEPTIWNDPVFASVTTNTWDFAMKQMAQLSPQVYVSHIHSTA